MKNDKYEDTTFRDFKKSFDSIYGLDSVYYDIEEQTLACFADNSPLDERVNLQFKYKPAIYSEKSFKAVWLIYENELKIMFVNGIINGKMLFTYDFIPEHPDNEIGFTFKFCGRLYLRVQQSLIPPNFKSMINKDNSLSLEFKDGKLVI